VSNPNATICAKLTARAVLASYRRLKFFTQGTSQDWHGSSPSPKFLQRLHKSPREFALKVFKGVDDRPDMLHIENQVGPGLGEQNAPVGIENSLQRFATIKSRT
jgi:hypothetical protein